jgi:hypothetical protein
MIALVKLPKQLEFIKFSRPYKAPPTAPESERTPEVIEAEMKALEASMEALALVTLKYTFFFILCLFLGGIFLSLYCKLSLMSNQFRIHEDVITAVNLSKHFCSLPTK